MMFKDDPDFAKHNQKFDEVFTGMLREQVATLESLQSAVEDARKDFSDQMLVAKSQGFDTKILRRLLRDRKRDQASLEEEEDLLSLYRSAVSR